MDIDVRLQSLENVEVFVAIITTEVAIAIAKESRAEIEEFVEMAALVEVIFKDFKALISTVEVVAAVASLAWDMASS